MDVHGTKLVTGSMSSGVASLNASPAMERRDGSP